MPQIVFDGAVEAPPMPVQAWLDALKRFAS
jgi:hypothetical protein